MQHFIGNRTQRDVIGFAFRHFLLVQRLESGIVRVAAAAANQIARLRCVEPRLERCAFLAVNSPLCITLGSTPGISYQRFGIFEAADVANLAEKRGG